MRLRISKLHEAANGRPLGYVEDALSRGTIYGDWLEISPEAMAELRAKYRPDHPLPPITTMATSAASAVVAESRAVIHGVPPVTAEEKSRRMAICVDCSNFRESDSRCSLCGCYANFKTRLRSQGCPVGKW